MTFKSTLSLFIICVCLTSTALAEVNLYLSDKLLGYKPDQAAQLFERLHAEDPDKNILIYVHGRGRSVQEEWDSLANLEKIYNVRVLMFDWPSWSGLIKRPVKSAEESSVQLSKVFNAIRMFKQDHGQEKSFSLLCHSMGNVVFSHFIKQFYVAGFLHNDGYPLIENFIANAPDVALAGHAEWLAKIDFAHRRFVLMNNRDIVLLLSYMLDIKERSPQYYKLGLGFQNLPLSDRKIQKTLDPDTTYIDFSYSLKNEHRYFERGSETIINVLRPMINGEDFYPRGKVKLENNINFIYD